MKYLGNLTINYAPFFCSSCVELYFYWKLIVFLGINFWEKHIKWQITHFDFASARI